MFSRLCFLVFFRLIFLGCLTLSQGLASAPVSEDEILSWMPQRVIDHFRRDGFTRDSVQIFKGHGDRRALASLMFKAFCVQFEEKDSAGMSWRKRDQEEDIRYTRGESPLEPFPFLPSCMFEPNRRLEGHLLERKIIVRDLSNNSIVCDYFLPRKLTDAMRIYYAPYYHALVMAWFLGHDDAAAFFNSFQRVCEGLGRADFAEQIRLLGVSGRKSDQSDADLWAALLLDDDMGFS